ncbi:MAG: hypothetical protein P8J93_04410 [SAR86 cluster bacterium]|jgi:hypothetical protein|nr:hypothetical protein [SAR86 cluster bacterium]
MITIVNEKASEQEFLDWRNKDSFMNVKQPLIMFVMIPAIVQITCLAMMLGSILLTQVIFN